MALRLPMHGNELVEMRAKRKRPAAMILIADGDYPVKNYFDNFVLKIPARDDPKNYDWTCLTCLSVEVITEGNAARTIRWANALIPLALTWLCFWFVDTGDRLSIRRIGSNRVVRELTEAIPWN